MSNTPTPESNIQTLHGAWLVAWAAIEDESRRRGRPIPNEKEKDLIQKSFLSGASMSLAVFANLMGQSPKADGLTALSITQALLRECDEAAEALKQQKMFQRPPNE